MARYRRLDRHIWTDPAFRVIPPMGKLEILESIILVKEVGEPFKKYAGPIFRIADNPRRRPDLSTNAWRRLRLEVLQEQGPICFYCQADCSHDPTIDHVFPVSQGADPLDKTNLVVSCRACNSHKGGKEAWA